MDAPTMSSDGRRELAELRSRAYGRDADIQTDSVALARLLELEELARVDGSAADEVRLRPDPPAAASGTPERRTFTQGAPPAGVGETGTATTDAAPSAAAGTSTRAWWKRGTIWALLAVAVIVGVVLGVAVSPLGGPQPIAVLRQVPLDGDGLDFELYGIRAESPVRYESFHDLEVWSGGTEQGSMCIVVTTSSAEWMTSACAPEPLEPMSDITFYPGMRAIDGLELADGSVVRFVLRGDAMEVWIAETVAGA